VDKIRKARQNLSTTRDVGGEGVQQALLKLIEGTEVRVQPQGGRRHPGNDTVAFDTSNVLFICGGSFAGIEQLIADRKAAANTQSGIGFGAKVLTVEERTTVEKNILHSVTRADLTKFGMIPELLGRLPVLVTLDEMDEDLLVHVLTAPKDAIVKQMERLFFIQNVKLSFTDAGLRAIARKALAEGTGARGLRTIIEELLLETRFSMAADGVREVTVTASGDDLRVETKARQAA
jgi:ATP-dependent Clp protease ATP-binding subunit ClpX